LAARDAYLTYIDFDDMINLAREHVARGSYRSPFRYIVVDEFQDMAVGRAKLVAELRNQVKGAKLFCVGDDWQSIYRFTGSDIVLTTAFDQYFGFTRKTALDRTFRFHNKIAAFSSRFVQQNPSQIRKLLSTQTQSDQPGVVVWMRDRQNDPLWSILTEIAGQGASSVFVLSRYRHGLPKDLKQFQQSFPLLDLQAMTAHASKGMEADFVVVRGLSEGKYGFPSNIADDPVLTMVLAGQEPFEFAEERRLFYVVLTRARKRVYLVADAQSPSIFVREIVADRDYEKVIQGSPLAASDVCPRCERGQVLKREGEYGLFYSCSNFPICTYRGVLCPRCKRGRMQDSDLLESRCDACDFVARVCPKCRRGILQVKHNGQSGHPFWACSMFGSSEPCSYTERVTSKR
jgi:DNA helicase-4